jgi:hypothetical protein
MATEDVTTNAQGRVISPAQKPADAGSSRLVTEALGEMKKLPDSLGKLGLNIPGDDDGGESDSAAPGDAGATAAEGGQPPKPAAAPGKGGGGADGLTLDAIRDLLKPLADDVAKMKSGENTREAARRAEDAREQFIRENGGSVPPQLLRKLLPATEDRNALGKAGQEINGYIKSIIAAGVAAGRLRYVDLGGSVGGESPMQTSIPTSQSSQSLVTQALGEANRPTRHGNDATRG